MATLSMPPQTVTPRAMDARSRGAAVQRAPGPDVAWAPDRDLEHPEWVRWGRRLGAMSRVSSWWVGDWLQYGASRWGEKYAEAARITGYDVKTLRNMAYVAKRFDLSRRRDKLTWSHHAEVAVLELEEQDRWLDRAVADHLSVADLRTELRSRNGRHKSQASSEPTELTDDSGSQEAHIDCPHCGHSIPSSLLVAQLRDLPVSEGFHGSGDFSTNRRKPSS